MQNGIIARLETERDEFKADFEAKLTQMITISEHEAILNSELQK